MNLSLPKYAGRYGKESQLKFYGYDRLGTEGAIRDMKNMTSDYWPELAVRPGRKIVSLALGGACAGLFSHKGKLGRVSAEMVMADANLYYDGELVKELFVSSKTEKIFASIGDYVVIWPDKVYYDSVSGETGKLEVSASVREAVFCHEAAPGGISSESNCLRLGVDVSAFKAGDAVTISGCSERPKNNQTVVIREVGEGVLYFLDNTLYLEEKRFFAAPAEGLPKGKYDTVLDGVSYILAVPELAAGDELWWDGTEFTAIVGGVEETIAWDIGSGSVGVISFGGMTVEEYTESGTITVARKVPDLDFVFEHGNRLMGCKDDTIYISAAGDIFNWNLFDGTAADSFTTDTGTSGKFTGGISYYGYPRFFKEDYIFTLFGDYPAEYALQKYECHGVMEGSGKSLAVVNGRLFYLSRFGPQVYTGSLPSRIADAFGTDRYINGVGGSDGLKYYLSMESTEDGTSHLFVYDTEKGLWMREDDTAMRYAVRATDLYYMDKFGMIGILGRAHEPPEYALDEDTGEWFVEFGDITDGSPDRKLINKLQIRLEIEDEASVTVKMLFDSGEEWTTVGTIVAGKKRSVTLPIIPRRLDHFRLRIEGVGMVRISSITRQFASASER